MAAIRDRAGSHAPEPKRCATSARGTRFAVFPARGREGREFRLESTTDEDRHAVVAEEWLGALHQDDG